jgi:hypothetical protein
MRTGPLAGLLGFTLIFGLATVIEASPAAGQPTGDTLVSVGSPPAPFSQNKQNEPAVAIDASRPRIVAAGANDNIDMEACNAGDPTTCPFTEGVGSSGVYFSFDRGSTWTQPTYPGLTARDCLGPAECIPEAGPIGTLPGYDDAALVSDGDPALAFGPRPDADGRFLWSNGSRLYYANLTSSLPGTAQFKGIEAIAVSRTDAVRRAAEGGAAGARAWKTPVIVSEQSSATFADKEQIWADNAASSPFFGNVYVCFARFNGSGSAPLVVATSRDGGDTWESKKVTPAHAAAAKHWGQSGCTVRTDSEGVTYVFYQEFQNPEKVGLPSPGAHFMVKSPDGGDTWTHPIFVGDVVDPCFLLQFDGTTLRCVHDGIAGARNDLSASPSIDIANGAPTGADATDAILMAWVDGRDGLNHEHVLTRWSTDRGASWSGPQAVERPDDRGLYAAPALSPDGTDAYLIYNAFTTRFRDETTSPRGLVGQVLHTEVGAGGAPTGWALLHRGEIGDPRASSQNNLVMEFLGDYVYAAATNDYATAVWNDVRDGAPCPAVQAWRARVQELGLAGAGAPPEPQNECPARFGNTNIFGGSWADRG